MFCHYMALARLGS